MADLPGRCIIVCGVLLEIAEVGFQVSRRSFRGCGSVADPRTNLGQD